MQNPIVTFTMQGGRTFKADCEVSDRQRGALLAGGTLNYAKQNAK